MSKIVWCNDDDDNNNNNNILHNIEHSNVPLIIFSSQAAASVEAVEAKISKKDKKGKVKISHVCGVIFTAIKSQASHIFIYNER
jgi:Holliday junction resolvasome RuvABC endonuclease subunit